MSSPRPHVIAQHPDSERTPLIKVVHTYPPYEHQRKRRSCVRYCFSCVLSILLLATVAVSILLVFVIPECRSHKSSFKKPCTPKRPFGSTSFGTFGLALYPFLGFAETTSDVTYDDLIAILSSTPDEEKAMEWSKYYTSGPHLAGKNLSQAEWTRDKWVEFGVPQSEIVTYEIYVNYPVSSRLALLEQSENEAWKVKYEASLKEDVLEEDATSGLADRIPTFHGYSASGNVTASYVFCNYGTLKDFEDLVAANVTLEGNIALIKYGGIFRGLKVKRAQELKMIGAVIYTDPGDDGSVTEDEGDEAYPDGPARQPSSVQRGSVQFLSVAPGDPTTPGVPSKPGVVRSPANASTPSIPSIPISYTDALPLLKALNGYGPEAATLGESWMKGGLRKQGVKYNIGPSPPELALNLVNEQDYVITPMWNVIGVINGTIPDEVVILGNHRDAWVAGGAGDPNSGSAAMNEVVRSLGIALKKGWRPLRTIVLASWDGEEYGLLGSTEWVEEYVPWLNATAVAYLNVDVGSVGPNFKASAAPLLNKALIETTKLVLSPNQTVAGQTVYDTWSKHISTMGSGSDFTAFQDYVGIPSVDMGFAGDRTSPVYHYHSNYDSFYWMNTYGDPGFHYHATIARIWALLTARIVETPVIDFNATDYAIALQGYLKPVKERADDLENPAGKFALTGLEISLGRLLNASISLDAEAEVLAAKVAASAGRWQWDADLAQAVRKVNNKYKTLERQFIYKKGLDGRSWYKHVVFAPGLWTGYAGATFPGLVEALDAVSLKGLYKWGGIITGLVIDAVEMLETKPAPAV
ncbi:glutamate carboxypeptidase [Trichodelitschia bisporula]|uniref:Glutamate carboxypeptidase n=1 Tax=Trichodelitschia bisporula TaxID=703511 RepID=A0A6G1I7P0_9PEZI|nr:glutamate carboxypeptidase [Trichodelitschia bisporula]